MTPTEIVAVTKAWEADPKSKPRSPLGLIEWNKTMQAWFWRPTPYSDELSLVFHPEALIRDALHRRLLELGAFVQPADGGYIVYNQTNQGSIAWSPDSLIIAMARGIIALAKENP